jgi:carbamate kinase
MFLLEKLYGVYISLHHLIFIPRIYFQQSIMKKRAVIALGGNALIKKNQKGTIYEQFANTRESCQSIVQMIKEGWDVVITHGNGPQVGALVLQVIVDSKDPSLINPTKPIGPYYTEDESFKMLKQGYHMTRLPRGWRMVVPSPDPLRIVEGEIIRKMLDDDIIVIASGGGGMPVIEKEGWGLDGLEAVVDKDLAAERLAEAVHAQVLLILTDVEKVYLHYNTPDQQPLDKVTYNEMKKYYLDGEFPPGNMGPKILAALRFLECGGERVVISNIEQGREALQGKTGTLIVRN